MKINSGTTIHPALLEGWSKIYGYTSDESGIRHSATAVPNISRDFARYFLNTCAAETAIVPRFRCLGAGDVTGKGPGDLVTAADREAEQLSSCGLREILDIPGVGEEAVAEDPSLLGAQGWEEDGHRCVRGVDYPPLAKALICGLGDGTVITWPPKRQNQMEVPAWPTFSVSRWTMT
ncbi:hypothetical protein [Nocardia sp. NPDC004711]